ncbi:MAG: cytidylyltransferase domain-containing protein, partial [Pseudobdellovibrionaceae bacterium]
YQNLNKKFDVVVNVQGDEPLITGAVIDQLVQPYLKSDSCVMSTLAHPLSAEEILSPHSVKVICNQYQEAIYFSRYAIPYSRKNAGAEQSLICYKHMGLYAYQVDFLQKFCEFGVCQLEEAESLEQLRALYMGVKIKVGFTSTGAQGVDTPEDVLKVERILKG